MEENKPVEVKKIVINFSKPASKNITELNVPVIEKRAEAKPQVTENNAKANQIIQEPEVIAQIKPQESPKEVQKNPDSEAILLELISPNKSIDLKINEMISEMPKSYAIIIMLPRAQHELRYLRLVKFFTDKNIPGIYLTLNKGVGEILELMKAQKINADNITFIDAVTKMSDGAETENDNFIYLESPDDITELTRESDNAISAMKKGAGFFIVDSITTLIVYNKPVVVEKFLHTLAQKIKNMDLQGVFLASESTDKETLDTISQFCDDVKNF